MIRVARQLLLVLLIASALSVVHGDTAFACLCVRQQTVQEAFQGAQAVFSGKVLETAVSGTQARVEVARVWKGALPGSVVQIRGGSTEGPLLESVNSCDLVYGEGIEYLIYAGRNDDGSFVTHICSRTSPLDSAQEDLAVLGAGRAPPAPTTEEAASDESLLGLLILGPGTVAVAAVAVILMRRRRGSAS